MELRRLAISSSHGARKSFLLSNVITKFTNRCRNDIDVNEGERVFIKKKKKLNKLLAGEKQEMENCEP